MAVERKRPNPHPEWRDRRLSALDKRAARDQDAKENDAFSARYAEHEVIARILERRYGVDAGHARYIALSAPSSPASATGYRKKGRPPAGYKLYEKVEYVRRAHGGKLPIGKGFPFWQSVTLQWNASNYLEHPERMYLMQDGLPDSHALRTGYMTAARALEAKAEALFKSHGERCDPCAAIKAKHSRGIHRTAGNAQRRRP